MTGEVFDESIAGKTLRRAAKLFDPKVLLPTVKRRTSRERELLPKDLLM